MTPNDPGPNGAVYIVSAARTPIGKFGGALSTTPAVELGGVAIAAAVESGLPPDAVVDEVLMGQVLQAGVGQAPARKAALKAGLPETTSATTINRVCGSGLKSIMLAAAGRSVLLASGPCPTPACSAQVVSSSASFGLVVTASHNPPAFNGIKLKDEGGGSAGTDLTAACESRLPEGEPPVLPLADAEARGLVRRLDFGPAHVDRLSRMVDLEAIRRAGLRVVTDCMHGTCGRLLERLLAGGATRVETLHPSPDPLFGGLHPEPLEQNLEELRRAVRASGADAGFATDGDGDRIGAFDDSGRFVSPLRLAPLLAWSLIRKGRRGPLAKTFANTLLLDRIARRYGLPF
ncbi:MAG: hypothetical protein L0221_03270, partial [Chloroflexi bacterium]|nr:hypothetical protein [Chloroflexota bacterium]